MFILRFAAKCCFALLLLAGTVNAAKPDTYTIATFEYPGFVEGKVKATDCRPGLGVELVRAAFAAVDITVVFERLSMARLMLEVIAGKHAMIMGSVWYYPAEAREKLRLIPMLSVTKVAFYNKSHFAPESDDVYEVLGRQTVVTNFAPSSAHTKGIKHHVVRDPVSVLDLVMSGREKLGALPWMALVELSRQNYSGRVDEIQILKKALNRSPAGIAFALDDPESETAQAAFSQGLSMIESNGTADDIRASYYPSLKQLDDILSMEVLHNY